MRVFLAGATGAIGRPLVSQLIDAGHEVTGITRSQEGAAALEWAGAHAVVCDALLAEPLAGAVADAKPEVVIHQLTALPDRFEPRKKGLYEPTNQLRTVGTRNLLAAARAVRARRFVCQSIAFAYEPSGGAVKVERDPLFSEAPDPFGSAIAALEYMEKAVLDAEGSRASCFVMAGSTALGPTSMRMGRRQRTCAAAAIRSSATEAGFSHSSTSMTQPPPPSPRSSAAARASTTS
jgi:nucleoside-diphosphate-sugar epimerase